jgi:hypothetical protein
MLETNFRIAFLLNIWLQYTWYGSLSSWHSWTLELVNCIGIRCDRHWIWSLNIVGLFRYMTLKLQGRSCSYLQLMASFLIKTWDPKQL